MKAEQALAAGGHHVGQGNGPFHCGILASITAGPTPAGAGIAAGIQQQQRSYAQPPPALVATEAPTTESDYTTGDMQPPSSPTALLLPNGEVPSGVMGSSDGLKPVQRQSSFSQYSLVEPMSPPDTPVHRLVQQLQNDPGADSDSGSHCALLPSSIPVQRRRISSKDRWDRPDSGSGGGINIGASGDPAVAADAVNGWPGSSSRTGNGNNNEYHELREIKQTQI